MFAVIKTGGKQYRVSADDVITVGRIAGEAGDKIEITEVLFHGEGENVSVGSAIAAGFAVQAEIVKQARGAKVIAFKKRRRQDSQRKRGHRQDLSIIRILSIGGQENKKPKKSLAKKAEAEA